MRLLIADHYSDMCRKAASIIAAQITIKPKSVLGLATGSTPIGIYEQLATWCQHEDLDFSQITTVNLDEYYGLAPDNAQSYHYFMAEHLFSKVNLPKGRQFLPDGMNQDTDRECERYQNLIELLGGIDIQLLGLGHNGHIGFNEPSDAFVKDVHLVDLAEKTIEANKRFFDKAEDVPRKAYTMGIGTIFQAEKILLVVSGAEKAGILKQVMYGPISPRVPGSILQLHADVTVVADQDAAGELTSKRN
ncbi:MAG: glucosamine-6-phosphate deaminase [Lachnospiraceae bacterium]|nr:glucosamine-6-phosphate deaminase [Lachnospiraceae bacterium]